MIPTMKLRFVVRGTGNLDHNGWAETKRILQQWWDTKMLGFRYVGDGPMVPYYDGEWRDVPTENEDD